MLNEWKRIIGLIPTNFLPLMQPHISHVEEFIRPGLNDFDACPWTLNPRLFLVYKFADFAPSN